MNESRIIHVKLSAEITFIPFVLKLLPGNIARETKLITLQIFVDFSYITCKN